MQARSFSELTVELQDWIDLNDPHREEVQSMIENGWIAAHEGRVGFLRAIAFEVAFEDCAEDGMFDDAEIKLLRGKSAGFSGSTIPDDRRARLMERKAAMDAEVRAKRFAPIQRRGRRGGGDLANWKLPDDVQDAIESAGWEVERCRDDEIDGILFVFCNARKGPLHAEVQVDRYPRIEDARAIAEAPRATATVRQDGDTVMTVTVLDGQAAITLRDAIVPKGDTLNKLRAGPVQAALRGGGWDVEGCDPIKDGSLMQVSCAAKQRGRQALVDVVLEMSVAGDAEGEERILREGQATVVQASSSLTASVTDTAPANELVEAILK
ncbi:MAG: hypothetical protein KTR31_16830 [Myxococcales bacterium]|nr:hypothetical protein [Myxococcales bacterium]